MGAAPAMVLTLLAVARGRRTRRRPDASCTRPTNPPKNSIANVRAPSANRFRFAGSDPRPEAARRAGLPRSRMSGAGACPRTRRNQETVTRSAGRHRPGGAPRSAIRVPLPQESGAFGASCRPCGPWHSIPAHGSRRNVAECPPPQGRWRRKPAPEMTATPATGATAVHGPGPEESIQGAGARPPRDVGANLKSTRCHPPAARKLRVRFRLPLAVHRGPIARGSPPLSSASMTQASRCNWSAAFAC